MTREGDPPPRPEVVVYDANVLYPFQLRNLLVQCAVDGLGSVGNHREWMTAAARWIMAAKLRSVLSLRMAIRLNSFSLPKKFSIR